jgi:flagellar hook-length control protein FliK
VVQLASGPQPAAPTQATQPASPDAAPHDKTTQVATAATTAGPTASNAPAQSSAPTSTDQAPAAASASQSAAQSHSDQQTGQQSHAGSDAQSQTQTTSQPEPVAATTALQSAPATQATQAADNAAPTRYGVSLQHAVETVRSTIELGARQGFSQARIELSPASLGTIRIQLHRTADGVTAHVVTDSAATADTLSQNSDDLRRSLQSAGVNLLSLDIEARSDGGEETQDPNENPAPRATAAVDPIDTADDSGSAQVEPTTAVLPGGARVNVLA